MYGFKQLFVYKYCIFGQSYCNIVVQQSLPWTKFTFKYWILFGLNAKNSLGLDHEIEFRYKSELMLSLVHMLHAFKNIKNRNFSCFGENTLKLKQMLFSYRLYFVEMCISLVGTSEIQVHFLKWQFQASLVIIFSERCWKENLG